MALSATEELPEEKTHKLLPDKLPGYDEDTGQNLVHHATRALDKKTNPS